MELFFQEKLSLNGKVVITDMEEKVVFTGKNSFNKKKTFLFDENKKKLATITYNNGLFNKGYLVKIGRKKVALIKKKLSLVNQNFKIKKLDWDVKGNFASKEYTISKGDETIAVIKRAKLVSLLEGYSVNITNDEDVVKVMCVALVLNKILHNKKMKLIK